ncbi:NAD-dependent epimerase/dehydratase family protein [Actinomadura geliboluensis]|uniref:NAD-dependent epimerase/dehydratase family protein n=1 Tax=Actinomadura geliboluensis TaxID=882440 RepID=A0A5S4H0Z7_9ACTN|nr:NAD-dependent epimerase/dehydratase family protein [Actinomadura geliboluensis]TMR38364.1 NAD-dependent epimerase/dehydratase family protein [Actinomadura geliboluensis]
MRLLMLGGTEFVGRAITEDALARGWDVTVFHRGRHDPPAGVRSLHGDRTTADGLKALADGEWDAVVDTWSGAPSAVRDAARLLAGRVGRYVYISSVSVYRFPTPPGLTEETAVVDGSPDAGDVDYAAAKRGSELAALDTFGDKALLMRAGLILGPYENIGRLPWWLNRIAQGGDVLAPGPRDLGLQYIDVRDLAAWTLDAAEQGLGGPYNLVSRPAHTTMEELLQACIHVTGSKANLVWTAPETILKAGIQPWTDLPVWLPPGEAHDTMHQASADKALAAGLRCRPVQETVADTWQWLQSIGGRAPQRPDRPVVGLAPDKEAETLRSGEMGGDPGEEGAE